MSRDRLNRQVSGYDPAMEIILGPRNDDSSPKPRKTWSTVDWRSIVAAVLVVGGFLAIVLFVVATQRILLWIVIAGFFAIVLAPSVRLVQAKLGDRRGVATAVVMFSGTLFVLGLAVLLVMPIRSQVIKTFAD